MNKSEGYQMKGGERIRVSQRMFDEDKPVSNYWKAKCFFLKKAADIPSHEEKRQQEDGDK